jgi:microcin C transport system permease protein
MTDLAKIRIHRFRKNRRAYASLVLLLGAYLLSLTTPWTVNDEPLFLSYGNEWYFPAFRHYSEATFGGTYQTSPDYKKLVEAAKQNGTPVFAVFPPVPWNPVKADLEESGSPPYPPSARHWLGTDSNGRDVLSRLLHGFRICMSFSLLLAVLCTFLGIVIGGIQGYLGGKVDLFLQRGIEIWASLPFLYVVILIGSIYGQSFWLLVASMAIFNWVGLSYYMRGEFLRLRQVPFVDAARVQGLSGAHIFFKEILPNALTPVVTLFPFSLIGGISGLTSLDFLGFGLPPPTPSWGDLMSQGLSHLYAPWIAVTTVAALFGTLLLSAFVGEGIRDAMDPKVGDRFE